MFMDRSLSVSKQMFNLHLNGVCGSKEDECRSIMFSFNSTSRNTEPDQACEVRSDSGDLISIWD